MGSLGMLFYVVECFSVNLENLATDAVGSAQLGRINEQIQSDRGFVAIALGESAHQIDQIGALNTKRAKVRNDLAQLRTFILNSLLEAGEAADGLLWRAGYPAAQDIQLDFDAHEGLNNPVMQVACDAAALRCDSAGA